MFSSVKPTDHTSSNKYWDCWELRSDDGRQTWNFNLPEELKRVVQSETDWQKPEAQQFLADMSEAFVFDKRKNANSSDLVYRSKVNQQSVIESFTPLFNSVVPNSDAAIPPCKREPVPTFLRDVRRTGDFTDVSSGFTPSKVEVLDITESESKRLKEDAYRAAYRGFDFFQHLQKPEGNWPSDYGGPMFLIPGLVIVSTVSETPLPIPQQVLLVRYMLNHQNEDGGWGLHIEGDSTMFGTVLQYVTLRLLGQAADQPALKKARAWIQKNGGTTLIPPWGKFYLSLLGIYSWEGSDSLFPELWILPRALPFHPGRYWCHARMVALGMTYCFGHRITMPETQVVKELRDELYTEPYNKIDWKRARKACHGTDAYQPLSSLYKVFSSFANAYEKMPIKALRNMALDFIGDYVDAEDEHTRFVNIGPVNQVINSLCAWHRHGKDSEQFKQHVSRWQDYLWVAEDGMKVNGYNGSQLWDAAFAGQALSECGLTEAFPQVTERTYNFIDRHQIQRDPREREKYFRERSVGGWAFSTDDQGWPVTDCTAEGMKTALLLGNSETLRDQETLGLEKLKPTVNLLLNTQNENGGWASYEGKRGPAWIEKLNPSRIFSNIMVEYPYVECSSATMQGLKAFSKAHPDHRAAEIKAAIDQGRDFIKQKQRDDGSWYGSWGVCFTYGTWFGIDGLIASGENGYSNETPSPEIKKACEFLVSKQRKDGSWGESYRSCVEMKYIEHETGQIINTAWALLGLLSAGYPDKEIIENGIRFLLSRQDAFGDWPQEGISGVFNKNCMETYTAYRNVFPLWAIGRYWKSEA